MFDGDDEFHQFMAACSTTSLVPFPVSSSSFSFSFSAFDPYPSPSHDLHPPLPLPLISTTTTTTTLGLERERDKTSSSSSSCMDIDFTWQHVSRKLGEVGFKRSGEQCKEKFEEEEESCRQFHYFHPTTTAAVISSYNNNNNYTDDDLYTGDDQDENILEKEKAEEEEEEKDVDKVNKNVEEESHEVQVVLKSSNKCKKKRKKSSGEDNEKFEMFKGFCEGIAKKMIDQQEEFHKKLIEDIVKRDEENIASREEEANNFKNEERDRDRDRIKREIEMWEKSQAASAGERQATIIDFFNKFIFTSQHKTTDDLQASCAAHYERSGGDLDIIHMRKIRWPRDEVLALINLRCKLMSGTHHQSYLKEGGAKGPPLWERISQGMLELGYRRSAKRCKEKWENINKYFRKTKGNTNKKRSIHSRTCPYFHLLTSLYSAGN